MKREIQAGFLPPSALEWTRANYGISALSVHERAISMLRAQAQNPPSLKLAVNGGVYSYRGRMRLFLSGVSPEFSPPASGTRLDILYLDGESGELAIVEGDAAVAITDPLELPDVPEVAIPLAAVYLGEDQETITEADLYDLRSFLGDSHAPVTLGTFNNASLNGQELNYSLPDHAHQGSGADGGQIEAANLKSAGAMAGRVLTADGYLGCSWELARCVLINSVVLSSPTSGVTFSSISNAYSDLLLTAVVRSSKSTVSDGLWIRFNADTGSNYDSRVTTFLTSYTSGVNRAGTWGWVGYGETAASTSNAFSPVRVHIFSYTSALWKTWWSETWERRTAAANDDLIQRVSAGTWKSTSAVTSVTLLWQNGSNFVADCRFYLWGLR